MYHTVAKVQETPRTATAATSAIEPDFQVPPVCMTHMAHIVAGDRLVVRDMIFVTERCDPRRSGHRMELSVELAGR